MRLPQSELSQKVAGMALALDPSQGFTSRPPEGSLWLSSHLTPLHTCILLSHILLPPASEALTGPEISTAGLALLPLEQVCGLESEKKGLESGKQGRGSSWGLSRAALARRRPWKSLLSLGRFMSRNEGCHLPGWRVLQEPKAHSVPSLFFSSRPSLASPPFPQCLASPHFTQLCTSH